MRDAITLHPDAIGVRQSGFGLMMRDEITFGPMESGRI
jgi:hypothetical protein